MHVILSRAARQVVQWLEDATLLTSSSEGPGLYSVCLRRTRIQLNGSVHLAQNADGALRAACSSWRGVSRLQVCRVSLVLQVFPLAAQPSLPNVGSRVPGVTYTRRKQHRPGIAPNANTTHDPTAGSSAAPTKPTHTPT